MCEERGNCLKSVANAVCQFVRFDSALTMQTVQSSKYSNVEMSKCPNTNGLENHVLHTACERSGDFVRCGNGTPWKSTTFNGARICISEACQTKKSVLRVTMLFHLGKSKKMGQIWRHVDSHTNYLQQTLRAVPLFAQTSFLPLHNMHNNGKRSDPFMCRSLHAAIYLPKKCRMTANGYLFFHALEFENMRSNKVAKSKRYHTFSDDMCRNDLHSFALSK